MTLCSIETRTKRYVKGYGILSFGRSLFDKYRKQFLDIITKTALFTLKTANENVAHEAAEDIGEYKVKKKSPIKL